MVEADIGTATDAMPERTAAETRDGTAEERDGTADSRDDSADERDHIADERDRIADERDRVAEDFEGLFGAGLSTDTLTWASEARRQARADRLNACGDRRAAASGRRQSERDRVAAVEDRAASAHDRRSAALDGLTGAYVRDIGFLELDRELARAHRTTEPLIVAFVDVDGLKAINDAGGHDAGDAMLVAVGKTLRAELRPYDLIFRYGGDELVCALPGVGITEARRRFGQVRAALADGPSHGSVSVGLTQLRREDSSRSVVARADADLYRERRRHTEH